MYECIKKMESNKLDKFLKVAYHSTTDAEMFVDHWNCLAKHYLLCTEKSKGWCALTTF